MGVNHRYTKLFYWIFLRQGLGGIAVLLSTRCFW